MVEGSTCRNRKVAACVTTVLTTAVFNIVMLQETKFKCQWTILSVKYPIFPIDVHSLYLVWHLDPLFKLCLAHSTGYQNVHTVLENHSYYEGSALGPLLFTIYTTPIRDIIRRHQINFHLYSDDTQPTVCKF